MPRIIEEKPKDVNMYRLDLETLGPQQIMPTNLPGHCNRLSRVY